MTATNLTPNNPGPIEMQIGDFVEVNFAPGWLYVGRVYGFNEKCYTLSPAAWVQGVSGPYTEAAFDRKKITKIHSVKQVTVMWHAHIHFILCSESILSKKELDALEAIK